ncbi:MAG: DUF4276 family protein [Alphaproteobacteria bacterium]|nr:DUF4276 family protein [Alphaproteobacteria bacterium]
MTRLLVHVEGETEETFVTEVLRPHLYGFGYRRIDARLLGNTRLRSRRGGIRPWPSAKVDILRHLTEDRECLATTMVDFYGLPQGEGRAWPGRSAVAGLPLADKPRIVEEAILSDIEQAGGYQVARRLLPFVIMHEFEALLFSDCQTFARGIGHAGLAPKFQAIRDQFDTPEAINDSPETAPSKRVEQLVPGYEKPLLGTIAAIDIGLGAIRAACPHFRQWLERLEAWPGGAGG